MADVNGDVSRRQMRLLRNGAVIGAVLLGASLVVDLAGLTDPGTPRLPGGPAGRVPAIPKLPSTFPTPPTGIPTDLPTGLPTLPSVPGGAP